MNPSKFDAIVENRAVERVTKKVEEFRAEVIAAIKKLSPDIYTNFSPSGSSNRDHGWWPDQIKGDLKTILSNVSKGLTFGDRVEGVNEYPRLKWPKAIFDKERTYVAQQLLATMDEMQKALIAPAANANSELPDGETMEGKEAD